MKTIAMLPPMAKKVAKANISDIGSTRARNLLRGLIGEDKPSRIRKTLDKIHLSCAECHYKKSIEVIRTADIFKNNPASREFASICPTDLGIKTEFTPAEILFRINLNKQRLLSLSEIYKKAIESLGEQDFKSALNYCREAIDNRGVSCLLLRILFLIKSHANSDSPIVKEVDLLSGTINVENARYLLLAIKELCSQKTDYFNICQKINSSEYGVANTIARNFIDPIPRSESSYKKTLSAYYLFSLLDAYLFFASTQRLGMPYLKGIGALDAELFAAYKNLSKIELDLNRLLGDGEYIKHFYRESFLLIELDDIFAYKIVHGGLYKAGRSRGNARIPFERNLLNDYFENVTALDVIGNSSEFTEVGLKSYNRQSSSTFENSTALIYYVEKNDAEISHDDEKEFVRLMTITIDIGVICPVHYLNKIRDKATTDELKLVAACLVQINEKSQLAEHGLRAVLQNITINKFNGKICNLLDRLYAVSPAVTEHLVQTCDEMFLSKCFQLITNPNEAIENRARILEWYGHKNNDPIFIERAKNLRIDVQISKEKGTIDDSRIYVDPVKLSQWITDRCLNDITILLENLENENDSIGNALQWEKVKNGITTQDQIGALLLQCYDTFCSDNLFGIASYIGRRIRHGTLKGTGYREVNEFVARPKYQSIFSNKDFEDRFNSWLSEYGDALDQLVDRYVHIQTKSKPDGMIVPALNSVNKYLTANHMVQEIWTSFTKNKVGIEIPYIITDYCWRLIEEDLANIRRLLMQFKAKYAVFRYENHCEDKQKNREAQEFCQELNALTAEKYRTISLWFNKPSIASPSADLILLFRAVVSEIKEFFADYSPVIEVEELEYVISGGLYFVIYDALYILIYNAAKYGKHDGILAMGVAITTINKEKQINIAITSETNSDEEMENAKNAIDIALHSDCEDALVIEGRSGIKKLNRMALDNYINSVKYEFEGREIKASFNFKIDY